ncbi:HigA family addiction module antitoxin [uncultured Ruegeria sp.]|uniref:HigA family addiction module antitoxin n=1 Tax=uncultured Ruegeria sp. TaxID=259304 RepID=UPI00263A233B|nr:HigA family addiction module antitoxin [uncultured Ruegeria sp.]
MDNLDLLPTELPGEFITEELDARGMTQADLAFVLGWDAGQLNRLLKGKTSITPDTANLLADAFDMPAEFFMNLQQMYDLSRAKKADPSVKTRATWSIFPVREMINRGWISDTESSLLDLQMTRFFDKSDISEVPFVSDAPLMAHAAKKSSYESVSAGQYAWLHRVRQIAGTIECPPYDEEKLRNSMPALRSHFVDIDDLPAIPALLLACGVRLILVEPLQGAKIDGVCLWVDGQPVIGLTNRLDRLDNLCFVLRHEIEHVLRGDGREEQFAPIDEFGGNLDSDNVELPECEKAANLAAAEFCVDQKLLNSFVLRKSPYISEKDMLLFAARAQINPAIIVGQIHHKTQKYRTFRKYLKSIRSSLLEWRAVDGWGKSSQIEL